MQRQLMSRRMAGSAAAAALLAAASLLLVHTAQAGSNPRAPNAMLAQVAKTAAARMAASAAVVLPAPIGKGKPFRQTVVGKCSVDSPFPDLPGTFCRFKPIAVAADQLLTIETVSCLIMPPLGLILLATSSNPAKILNSIVGAGLLEGSFTLHGPFYVPPGEKVVIWGLGDPGSGATCTVHGLLSRIE